MAKGWVKIHRSILDWQWWPDDNTLRLWLYLILTANIEDRKWRNITVKRGQMITTIPELAAKTGLSYKSIRTCLDRLVESGEIGRQTTNKFSIITICKFDTYQVNDSEEGQTKGQTNGTQRADKGQTKGRQAESSPHTPLKDNRECKNKRIYYYSSLRACTREEQQEKQFFFIFYLKGASNPSEEAENFISWNTTPERASAWDSCPEYARYATARRWKVKGAKKTGYSEKAGKVLTALTDALIKKNPSFLEEIYDYNKDSYPCYVDDNNHLTLYCTEQTMRRIEEDVGLVKSVLHRNGIEKLFYRTPTNQ